MGRMEDKFSCMKVTSCLTEKRAERLILSLSQVVFQLKTKVQGEYGDSKINYIVACDDDCLCRV